MVPAGTLIVVIRTLNQQSGLISHRMSMVSYLIAPLRSVTIRQLSDRY